nr:MAG TPA: protein NinB [Caudoviricetes sp.]
MYISQISQLKQSFRALFTQAELMLNAGKRITVEISEKKQKRSNEQNSYYWLFNGQLADFLNQSGLSYGEHKIPYTGELIHEINKKLFGIKTTTKMSTGEFCQYMNKLLLFWQEKTQGEFMMSELPANYLERKGYFIK